MADLRTEEQITREIDKQYKLLKKVKGSTSDGIALKKKIIQLEAELGITQNQNSKKENAQQQEIQKQIDARIKKVRSLNGLENKLSKIKATAIKGQNATLQLLKHEAGMKGGLTKVMQEQQSITEDIGTGSNDASGFLALQAQSVARMNKLKGTEELINQKIQIAMENGRDSLAKQLELKRQTKKSEQDIEKSLGKNLKSELKGLRTQQLKNKGLATADSLSGGMVTKAKDFGEKMGISPKNLAKLGIAGFIVGVMIKAVTGFSKKIDEVGQSFGFMTNKNEDFRNGLIDSGNEAMMVGKNLGDVVGVVTQLSSEFGITLDEAENLSNKILDTAVATGISNDEATKLFGTFMQIGGLTSKQAEDLIEGTAQLAAQKGVAPTAVLRDMAASSEEIAGFTKDGGNNIAEAAIQARQMGLSLSTTAGIAKSLLDFESSIAAEQEASIMIGKQLNFQKARQLALEGDIAGMMDNVLDQLGGEAEFNKLNVLQRESLAKSLNRTTAEMAKLVKGSEKLTLSGALAGKSFDDIVGQDALSGLTAIINSLKMVGAALMDEIGKPLAAMLKKFQESLLNDEGMKAFKDRMMGFVSSISDFFTSTLPNAMNSIMRGIEILSLGFAFEGKVSDSFFATKTGVTSKEKTQDSKLTEVKPMEIEGALNGGLVNVHDGEVILNPIQQQQFSGGGMTNEQAQIMGKTIAANISLDTKVTSNQLNIVLDGGLG